MRGFWLFVSVLDLIFPESNVASAGGINAWESFSSLNILGYLTGIFLAGLLGMTLNIVLRRIMFRRKQISMKILKAASAAGAGLGFVIICWFLGSNSIRMFNCPVWLMLGSSCAYLFFYYLLRGRHIKREKVKFFDLVQEESNKEFSKEMEKKYEKARKKNLKKGKGELSLETFLEKEEKDCSRTEKMKFFYYILPFIVTGSAFLTTWRMDGFESIADVVIFLAINMVIQYTLMMVIWKIARIGIKERREWIRGKRDENSQEKTSDSPDVI